MKKKNLIPKQNSTQLINLYPDLIATRKQKTLLKKLHDAEKLGNLFHNKIEIIFQDSEGLKEVNTTIWAVGEDHIVLKKGVFIPIHRIISINI